MRTPTRGDVATWWRQLIAGTLDREEVHELVARWVEGSDQIEDVIVELGVQHLHGFDLSRPVGSSRVLLQHGGGANREYVKSAAEVAVQFERWQQDAREFDENPVAWRRDRLSRLHRTLLREGRPQEANRIARVLSELEHAG